MTVDEAKIALGMKPSDVVVKAGWYVFERAYKKAIKDPKIDKAIKKTYEVSLEAVSVLLKE